MTAEIVEASAFADLVSKYRVGATPRIILNETVEVGEPYTPAALIARLVALPAKDR